MGLSAKPLVYDINSRQTQDINNIANNNNIPGQLSLLPSVGRAMSTSQSAAMLCGWGVKAGMVHSNCG